MDLLQQLLKNKEELTTDITDNEERGLTILVLHEKEIKLSIKYSILKKARECGCSIKKIIQVAIPEEKLARDYYYASYVDNIVELSQNVDFCVPLGFSNYLPAKGNGDLNIWNFVDVFYSPSYYWSPVLKCITFPCFSYNEQKSSPWKENHFDHQLSRIFKGDYESEWYDQNAEPKIIIPENKDIWDTLLNSGFGETGKIAVDIETTGFDFKKDNILNIAISDDGKIGYAIPWSLVDIGKLNKILKRAGELILSNGKFDAKFLKHKGVDITLGFDTLLAGHFLNEERSNSLKTHAYIYTVFGGYEEDLDEYKRTYKVKNYGDIPEDILLQYGGMDPIVTWNVARRQQDELSRNPKIKELYYSIGLPITNLFIDIEMRGMHIDWFKMDSVRQEFQEEIKSLDEELVSNLQTNTNLNLDELIEIKRKVNISLDLNTEEEEIKYFVHSNRNDLSFLLSKVLEKEKLPPECFNQRGELRTNEATLNIVMNLLPSLKAFLVRSSLLTCYRLFLDEEENKGINRYRQEDGRIHPTYSVMLATTHRYKCREPNIQQIPTSSVAGKKAIIALRSVFSVPDKENYYFAEIDFASFQLRIGAMYSEDKQLTHAFQNNIDLHTLTLKNLKYPNLTVEEVKELMDSDPSIKVERTTVGKTANFGMFFGSTVYTIYKLNILPYWDENQLEQYIAENNLPLLEHDGRPDKAWTVANKIHEAFFETYEGLDNYIKGQHLKAIKYGYVMSAFGSRKLLPELRLSSEKERLKERELKHALNISVNAPVQAFESAYLSRSLLFINDKLKKQNLRSSLVGCIHDSFLMYIYKDEVDIVKNIILEATTKPLEICKGIPVRIEGSISDLSKNQSWKQGTNWIEEYEYYGEEEKK